VPVFVNRVVVSACHEATLPNQKHGTKGLRMQEQSEENLEIGFLGLT